MSISLIQERERNSIKSQIHILIFFKLFKCLILFFV